MATTVLEAGLTTSSPAFGLDAASAVFVKSAAGITAVLPEGVVTVALPLSSTTTVAPGLTALTLSSIAFFSSGVRASGFATTVLSDGVLMSFPAFGFLVSSAVRTNSSTGITCVCPSGVDTLAFPFSSTVTTEFGFTASTAALIFSFSASVNLAGSATTTLFAGLTTSFPAFGSFAVSDVFTTCSGVMVS